MIWRDAAKFFPIALLFAAFLAWANESYAISRTLEAGRLFGIAAAIGALVGVIPSVTIGRYALPNGPRGEQACMFILMVTACSLLLVALASVANRASAPNQVSFTEACVVSKGRYKTGGYVITVKLSTGKQTFEVDRTVWSSPSSCLRIRHSPGNLGFERIQSFEVARDA
jgi:hypothetical protein